MESNTMAWQVSDHETAKEPGALDRLDSELGYLEETVKSLESILAPILNQYAGPDTVGAPKPEPPSRIRTQIERLVYLRCSLGEIQSRIDL